MWLPSFHSQMDVGLVLASTNPAPPSLRGKLSGLYLTMQSLGRTIGPACWAVMFAWSISHPSRNYPCVDFHLVFNFSAFIMLLVVVLSWKVLTEEYMTVVVEDPPTAPRPRYSSSQDGGTREMTDCNY